MRFFLTDCEVVLIRIRKLSCEIFRAIGVFISCLFAYIVSYNDHATQTMSAPTLSVSFWLIVLTVQFVVKYEVKVHTVGDIFQCLHC